MTQLKERLKSPVVWLAVIAQVCVIAAMFAPDLSDGIKTAGTCIVEILTLFGILNNPSDSENF
ncbi:MAG: phage holin family protein [Clostridiales bacterium]|nr:phage holin family protein [Clostridiales bacterium]